MLDQREREIPDFSVAQVSSNERVASQHSAFLLQRNGNAHDALTATIHTNIFTWLQLHSQGYGRLPYFTYLTLFKIAR